MRLLLYSGVLYLAGIAAVLVIKPDLMFRTDGTWKEFGIGRNPNNYTWFPFWIFAFVWAIVSYIIMVLLANLNMLPGIEVTNSGEIINNSNLSSVVYLSGDKTDAIQDMRQFAQQVTETPLRAPDIEPVISDINSPRLHYKVRQQIPVNTSTESLPSSATKNVLKNGYYILNMEATQKSGVPKYIFLGPEPPRILYK